MASGLFSKKILRFYVASLICGLTIVNSSSAMANSTIAEYCAYLGAEDLYTSKGVKLKSFGAVLAQDRANYHKFGIRQQFDYDDPMFHKRANRGKIADLYKAGPGAPAYIRRAVMNGDGHVVCVFVYGSDGRATSIEVVEGAG